MRKSVAFVTNYNPVPVCILYRHDSTCEKHSAGVAHRRIEIRSLSGNSQHIVGDVAKCVVAQNQVRQDVVVIDACDVEDVDTAALQLLLSFRKAAAAVGISIRWQDPSEEFTRRVEILNLEKALFA